MSDETPNFRWSWLVLLMFLFGCVLAALWMLAEVKRTRQQRQFVDPLAASAETHSKAKPKAIFAAIKNYTSELMAKNQTIPAWVSLRELVDRQLLRVGDVGDFGGAEVFISLAAMDEEHPSEVLAEARWPDGKKDCLLSDGSVQQMSRR